MTEQAWLAEVGRLADERGYFVESVTDDKVVLRPLNDPRLSVTIEATVIEVGGDTRLTGDRLGRALRGAP